MVKNTTGGNKTKNKARKDMNNNKSLKYDDLLATDDQDYFIITSVGGGGRYKGILYTDFKNKISTERLAITSGRIKRFARIRKGSLVLISIRDFQQDKVDILHVYSADEINLLINKGDVSDTFAKPSDSSDSTPVNIEFNNDTEEVKFEDL
jgi:translation initiation factor 1A